jgi:hypothetical protein
MTSTQKSGRNTQVIIISLSKACIIVHIRRQLGEAICTVRTLFPEYAVYDRSRSRFDRVANISGQALISRIIGNWPEDCSQSPSASWVFFCLTNLSSGILCSFNCVAKNGRASTNYVFGPSISSFIIFTSIHLVLGKAAVLIFQSTTAMAQRISSDLRHSATPLEFEYISRCNDSETDPNSGRLLN